MRAQAATTSELCWLEGRTGCVLTHQARGVSVRDAKGSTRGVVAFDAWTDNSCQAHMATDTPVAWRSLLGPALSYAFHEAGRGIILATILGSNARSLSLVRHLGFQKLATVPDGWAKGVALHLFELRREAWADRKAA